MKEKDFHNLIEQGNVEKKKKSLQIVQGGIGHDIIIENTNAGSNTAALMRSKKYIIPLISVFLAIGVFLIVFISLHGRDNKNDFPRFYSSEDYSFEETDITLKEYSQQNALNILYFDWYTETELVSDLIYKTIQSEEVICFREMIVDNDFENIIMLYVAEKDVQIDFLTVFETSCINEHVSDTGINIIWGGDTNNVFAIFAFGNFRYYLQIDDIIGEPEDILTYAEILLG